jgi:hypothetical protein
MTRKKTSGGTARTRKAAAASPSPVGGDGVRVYTLEVFLIGGPVTRRFAKRNPVVSRTILIRGDQTLEDLHHAIFEVFGREEEHAYEFQLGGKGPMDPAAECYVLPGAFEHRPGDGKPPAGRVDRATLDSLGLKEGDAFGYWFDFGDDWWHQINVEAVQQKVLRGKYPRVAKKVGQSPPQYTNRDEAE